MQLQTTNPKSSSDLARNDALWQEIDRVDLVARRSEDEGFVDCLDWGVTLAQARAAFASFEAMMAGADDETIRNGVNYVAEVLGCKRPNERVMRGYVSVLRDIPASLLPAAIKSAASLDAYHNLPTPGAFMMGVKETISIFRARRNRLHRLISRMEVASRMRARKLQSGLQRPAA